MLASRKIRRTRRLVLALIVVSMAMTACRGFTDLEEAQQDGGQEAVREIEEAEVVAALEGGTRLPLEFLVQATEPGEPKPARTLEEARTAIHEDEGLEPLRKALEAGGWSEDQRAQMVYFAGTHGSGQPEDSIRHRRKEIHETFAQGLARFREDLEEYEDEHNVRIDREMLRRNGIITSLKSPKELK